MKKPTVQNQQNLPASQVQTPSQSDNSIVPQTPAQTPKQNFLTYSGKITYGQSAGKNFSIQYPSSWVYFKYSCNIDGVAFWPKEIAPQFPSTPGAVCSMNGFLDAAPIILADITVNPQLELNNNSYKTVYDQMLSSLK
jgi:hypothetical protein